MTDDKIVAMEKEISIMASTQKNMSINLGDISQTLKELVAHHTETQLLTQRFEMAKKSHEDSIDRAFAQIKEDKKDIEERLLKIEGNLSKVGWLIISMVLIAVVGQVIIK